MPATICCPRGKALRASKANLARFEAERAELERRMPRSAPRPSDWRKQLDGRQFVVIRAASEAGALYGSVAPRDLVEAAAAEGFEFGRNDVLMDKPIKELGLHELRVVLHPEVIVSVTVNVARSAEEAEMQASGKSIQQLRAEEEAEAEFDIAELFDDIGGAALEEGDAPAAGPTGRRLVDVPENRGDDQPR